MQKKISINKNISFLIKGTKERLFAEDDVIIMLYIVICGKKYFIEKESYNYEISHVLKYFSESSNHVETESDDLGYEYFLYQSEFERAADLEIDCSRDLYEFGYVLAFFNNNIAVLFYKKAGKFYCQVTQNDWNKECKTLCIEEIVPETLDKWKKKLPDKFI